MGQNKAVGKVVGSRDKVRKDTRWKKRREGGNLALEHMMDDIIDKSVLDMAY